MTLAHCFLFLVSLLRTIKGGNILVCVDAPGSHQYSAANAANFLGENGHNVTLFTIANETRVNLNEGKNFTRVIHPEMIAFDDELDDNWEELVMTAIKGKTSRMVANIFHFSDRVLELHLTMYEKTIRTLDHPFFEEMLRDWKFDVIILDVTSWYTVTPIIHKLGVTIPMVMLHPVFAIQDIRMSENFPMLVSSEPNMMSSITQSATFSERLDLLHNLLASMKFIKGFEAILRSIGVTFNDLLGKHQMHFGMGHPALSFAALTPPNYKHLGFFTMKDHVPKPLPEPMLRFMDGCGSRPIVYMSFGTFLLDPTSLPWLKDFLHYLLRTDVCIIFKAHPESREKLSLPPGRVYMQYWMPQKDILSSKKIKFFLSHCGNNGRLEAIFFNVPILCVPLFTDQYLNAVLVHHREFGLKIVKEEIFEKGGPFVVEKVTQMLENLEKYKENTIIAKEAVVNDPGCGKNVFLYHINYIIKHGNARYLNNEMILNQSMIEIYNLDIIGMALAVITVLMVILALVVIKLLGYAYRKVNKPKTE